MARKRVVEAPSLHSWEDVNDALRQIAEAQIALGEIQSDMQKQILGAQKVAEEQSKPLNDNVAKLEREIKSFVTDHRDEMGKTKSMVLTFGEVGFRLSTSVSLPRAKEKLEEIIRRLKSRQMTDCIVVEEKVSKEALKKYAIPGKKAESLTAVGRAEETVTNTGADGELVIRVARGVFVFDNTATAANKITAAHVLKPCYMEDDHTVTALATGASVAGTVIRVDDEGVAVECGGYVPAAAAAGVGG